MSGERPGAIGRRAPLPSEYEDFRDPGNGEKVPRCGACGMPSKSVLRGEWNGKPGLWFPVCGACISRFNGPQPTDTDELRIDEEAA